MRRLSREIELDLAELHRFPAKNLPQKAPLERVLVGDEGLSGQCLVTKSIQSVPRAQRSHLVDDVWVSRSGSSTSCHHAMLSSHHVIDLR